jgi:hypothetical protein
LGDALVDWHPYLDFPHLPRFDYNRHHHHFHQSQLQHLQLLGGDGEYLHLPVDQQYATLHLPFHLHLFHFVGSELACPVERMP